MVEDKYISSTFINPFFIQSALSYYSKKFQLLSVPMCVNRASVEHTLSADKKNTVKIKARSKNSFYVGSAEQSFHYLYDKKIITTGDFLAITPCQRDEVEDSIHLEIFLKIELIRIGNHDIPFMLKEATGFFEMHTKGVETIDSGNKPFEKDLLVNGIEVGSYGIGYMSDGIPYTYGTALAEPRLSYAISLNKNN